MSETDDTKHITAGSEQPTIRFRQLCAVSKDTLLAVSEDGALYRQDYSKGAGEIIWRRLPVVSSTDLQARRCSIPGCDSVFEALPTAAADERCPYHMRFGRNG